MHQQQLEQLKQIVAEVQAQGISEAQSNGVPNQNNITFTWTGGTLTVSWAAGYVKDHHNHFLPIPAGSRALSASTFYWAGWNPFHRTMSFQTSLAGFKSNSNILILSQFKTGTGAQTGTAGGGGSDPGGDGLNGRLYINF